MAQYYVVPLKPRLYLRHSLMANYVYIGWPLSRDLTAIVTFEGGHIRLKLRLSRLVITRTRSS
jgi:hypothetical protein